MSVFIRYRVPVMVEIEPSERQVLSVHVIDESLEGPLAVIDVDGEEVSAKDRREAIEIAETRYWPGWTFGF